MKKYRKLIEGYLNAALAEELYGISRRTFDYWINQGKIRSEEMMIVDDKMRTRIVKKEALIREACNYRDTVLKSIPLIAVKEIDLNKRYDEIRQKSENEIKLERCLKEKDELQKRLEELDSEIEKMKGERQ